jgi:hypothetical protein
MTRSDPPPVTRSDPPPEPSSRRVRLLLGGALAVILLAAAGGGALLSADDPGERAAPAQSPAQRGTVCGLLAEAVELRGEDDAAFAAAIRHAARLAEGTLERSGQVFGAPERAALQLGFDVRDGRDEAVTAGLERAAEACASVGRWPQGR